MLNKIIRSTDRNVTAQSRISDPEYSDLHAIPSFEVAQTFSSCEL